MSQQEILEILTKDEWKNREKIQKEYQQKYGQISIKTISRSLLKLGFFTKRKRENKQDWWQKK